MIDVTYYNVTGKIVAHKTIQESLVETACPEGCLWSLSETPVNPIEMYVVAEPSGPVAIARPVMGVSVSPTTITTSGAIIITGIPAGTTFVHPDGEAVIDDGDLSWECDTPGIYMLHLIQFPYMEVTIRAKVV